MQKNEGWLVTELHSIRREDAIGEFTRRMFTDRQKADPKGFKEFWQDLPKWFRDEARLYLGGRFTPKAKPKNLYPSEIFKAIEEASNGKV